MPAQQSLAPEGVWEGSWALGEAQQMDRESPQGKPEAGWAWWTGASRLEVAGQQAESQAGWGLGIRSERMGGGEE